MKPRNRQARIIWAWGVVAIAAVVLRAREPVLRMIYSAVMVYDRSFYTRQPCTVQISAPPSETERSKDVADVLPCRDGDAR
jgi:hypothetical protein